MAEASLIYVTAKNAHEARLIGRTLLEERLIACVNIGEGIHSMYWWEGAIASEEESWCIMKTKTVLVDAVIERIKALHSYDCPCIVALPIARGNADFIAWICRETR